MCINNKQNRFDFHPDEGHHTLAVAAQTNIMNWMCLLTAEQKLQSQLCNFLVASDGCSLRHSLQKTLGPG